MATKTRVEARRANWSKRWGLTPDGRERLRTAAKRFRPWECSTGPRTVEGKLRARGNAVLDGERAKTVEPYVTVNRAVLAEREYGEAVYASALLIHRFDETRSTEPEKWLHRLRAASAALRQAQQNRQAAWQALAVALGLPEPPDPSAAGFDWPGFVLDHSKNLANVREHMALGRLCLASLRAYTRFLGSPKGVRPAC